jgi:hypothetical protein
MSFLGVYVGYVATLVSVLAKNSERPATRSTCLANSIGIVANPMNLGVM